MGKPAARVGDMHVCPMSTGPVPHVGGPVLPPGVPTVLIGGMPAATLGNMCTCTGPPDSIVMGSAGVFIGGMPAARMGDTCAHGGTIVVGCPTVLIGEAGGGGGAAMLTSSTVKVLSQSYTLKQGTKSGAVLCEICESKKEKEEEEENEISISNLKWKSKESEISKGLIGEIVSLTLDIEGLENGDSFTIMIYEKQETGENILVDNISCEVNEGKIYEYWTIKTNRVFNSFEDGSIDPEYIFTGSTEDTYKTESSILEVRSWIEVKLVDQETGNAISNTKCQLHLADGSDKALETDDEGYIYMTDLSLGYCEVSLSEDDNKS